MDSEKRNNDRVLTLIDQKITEKKIDELNINNELFSKLENLELTTSSILDEKINKLEEKKKNDFQQKEIIVEEKKQEKVEEKFENTNSERLNFSKIKEQQVIEKENVEKDNSLSVNNLQEINKDEIKNDKPDIKPNHKNEEITVTQEKSKNEYRKYILFGFVVILFVLTFSWVVYNTVKIKEVTQQVSSITETTNEKNVNIKKLISELNKLNTNEELKDQATAMDPLNESVSAPEEYEFDSNEIYQGETNFYDKISNFFQKLFWG